MDFKDLANYFLHVYLHYLELDLNENSKGLETVKFQSEEANTDEYLKQFFKDYILCNNTINTSEVKELVLHIDLDATKVSIEALKPIKIVNVYLPEELTAEEKEVVAKSKTSVYTNPDLFLEIADNQHAHYESIELKSTKGNVIPGSSVQQVFPFEWVIFVQHNKNGIHVSTGHYINSITEKLPFPDRSPRPQIGFNTLVNWNKKNRKLEGDKLFYLNDLESSNAKLQLLKDWQDFLTDEWLTVIQNQKVQSNEKWFNNALRKFAVKFLDYSESLSVEERSKLRKMLNSLIK